MYNMKHEPVINFIVTD